VAFWGICKSRSLSEVEGGRVPVGSLEPSFGSPSRVCGLRSALFQQVSGVMAGLGASVRAALREETFPRGGWWGFLAGQGVRVGFLVRRSVGLGASGVGGQ